MTSELNYNTQRPKLKLGEYGRSVQNMVDFLCSVEDREKRNRMAHALISVMGLLNPEFKDLAEYKQKLWDHLHLISDFKLDVDAPFPPPTPESISKRPERIPYSTNHIKFRFYGRNLQLMVTKAANMEEGETKSALINLIASFMRNSCRNWNNENLTPEAISDHLEILSKGKLKINPEELSFSAAEFRPRTNIIRKQQGKQFKGKFNKSKQGGFRDRGAKNK